MRRYRLLARVLVGVGCALALAAAAPAGPPPDFVDTLVASGLTRPTAMAWDPDGRLWVTEQDGKVRVIKKGELLPTPFVSLTVDGNGERGLLGIAFDPSFKLNHYVYVYYTKRAGADPVKNPAQNQVSRLTANGEVAVPMSELRIVRLPGLVATNHNGGAIHFGRDGKLYVATGDNDRNGPVSQSQSTLLGKILRINSDGTIPTDNPFYSNPAVTGTNKAIWALGFRNPFTFAFNATGRLFVNDVGAHLWEEIDDVVAGGNYGWKDCDGPFVIETTNPCSATYPSHLDPLFYYGHGTTDSTGCAITGGAFYNPPDAFFPASYVGKYFYADFCGDWIRMLDPSTKTDSLFATGLNQPVDLQVFRDGALYYLNRGSGSVRRISYLGHPELSTPDPTSGSVGTKVKLRGKFLAGATSVKFGDQPASFTVVWDTWIRTVVPAGAVGADHIEVTTPGGIATAAFTVT